VDEVDYGLVVFDANGQAVAKLSASTTTRRIRFVSGEDHLEVALPDAFSGSEFRQFRIVRQSDTCIASLDGIEIARLASARKAVRGAIFSTDVLLVDMVRATAI